MQLFQRKYFISTKTMFSLKHIYFSLTVKQVLAAYINHYQVRFLEPTNTGVI